MYYVPSFSGCLTGHGVPITITYLSYLSFCMFLSLFCMILFQHLPFSICMFQKDLHLHGTCKRLKHVVNELKKFLKMRRSVHTYIVFSLIIAVYSIWSTSSEREVFHLSKGF